MKIKYEPVRPDGIQTDWCVHLMMDDDTEYEMTWNEAKELHGMLSDLLSDYEYDSNRMR